MVYGYKCFNGDMSNRYGKKFIVGKRYKVDGNIKFGVNGNGFHMCKNIVDVFRYYDTGNDDFMLCEVIGSGKIVSYDDEYNGYYDMYSAQNITIDRIIERKELVEMFLTTITSEPRVFRFIQHYKLTEEEIEMFKLKYASSIKIMNAIKYYQEGQKDVYEKQYKVKKK